ncbi:pentapeptide repeat-containing protein [Oryzicola mucosus]|uniref:Leucine-rich repeat domain-containing protein n=1 Tax=Oryzicola mucosus TaxID=2767425 RepID=A0A8J6PVS0_9HYPH|nr:pentapeptide repeat-containing protein [Oryzicola mucosus]MBD0414908.1 leucine-rich repeat domain-containing protein [Oryzicola mucosus]
MIEKSASFSRSVETLLREIGSSGGPSFRRMAELTGLDPAKDFMGSNLSGLDFRDDDLSGFNFSGADLRFSDFRRAKIEGIILSGAQLVGAIGLPSDAQLNYEKMFYTLREIKKMLASGILPPEYFLESIKQLRFGDTSIKSIDILLNFRKLETLSLINRTIDSYAPISDLPKLTTLELNGSNIRALSEIGCPPELRHVDVSSSRLEDLSGVEYITKLRTIDFSSTMVDNVSPIVNKELIKVVGIATLVKNIESLSSLDNIEEINFAGSFVESASEVSKIKNLRRLVLSSTLVSSLENFISNPSIKILDLSNTKVVSFVPILGLPNLETLSVSQNANIGPFDGFSRLRSLKRIFCSGCSINGTLASLFDMESLSEIDLSENQIVNVEIKNENSKLLHLDISNNPLSNIDFILKLPRLSSIYLNGVGDIDEEVLKKMNGIDYLWADRLHHDTVLELSSKKFTRFVVGSECFEEMKDYFGDKFSIVGYDVHHNRNIYKQFYLRKV